MHYMIKIEHLSVPQKLLAHYMKFWEEREVPDTLKVDLVELNNIILKLMKKVYNTMFYLFVFPFL